MLNDQSIADALGDVIEHLQQQNLEQAEATLEVLNFERLLKRIPDPSKGRSLHFVDPAEAFGNRAASRNGRSHWRVPRGAGDRR